MLSENTLDIQKLYRKLTDPKSSKTKAWSHGTEVDHLIFITREQTQQSPFVFGTINGALHMGLPFKFNDESHLTQPPVKFTVS